MLRSQFCAMLGANAAFGAQAALACDVCGLPEHAKHRAGGHAMILKTTHSTYRSWPDVRLVVGIVNTSTKPLPIDTTTPIWKQSSLHVGGVTGESFADVPIGLRATLQLAPGATYYFRGMGGRTDISVVHWAGTDHRRRGRYALDITYARVDSPTIEFTIA